MSTSVTATAGLRVTPPDATGHAGTTLATLSPGVQVLVCGKYVRADGLVTWKGVVLLNPSDPRIAWAGSRQQHTGWVLSEKLS